MLREVPSHTLFTLLMLICLIVVAVSKLIAPKRFNDFVFVIGNFKYLKIYAREQKFFDNYDGLLFVNLIISLAIFIALCHESITGIPTNDISIIIKLILGIGVFVLIKVLIERLIGSLFEIDNLMDAYLFQKISYKNYLGLLLLPINAILAYNITPNLHIIYLVITLLTIVNISGLITSFKAHQNIIKHNLFYFILYLCAFEIAPYIILYALISQ